VEHATLNRWVLKYIPLLDQAFRARKHLIGPSWRMDETYVRAWKYLYRAVDKAGATVDFPADRQTGSQSRAAVLAKAIKWNGTREKITIAALESHTAETEANIVIRRIKYLNNIVEQDHRAIKRLVRSMLGFKSFQAAVTLAGIELMHTIRKGQLRTTGEMWVLSQSRFSIAVVEWYLPDFISCYDSRWKWNFATEPRFLRWRRIRWS
jgi:putative transposase